MMSITGYRRGKKVGIRNSILVVSTVACVNTIVQRIARENQDVIPVTHQHGCDHAGEDQAQVLRTLVGTCTNPNVGGVLLVGLGCETLSIELVLERLKNEETREVRSLKVQELGDFGRILQRSKDLLGEIRSIISKQERVPIELSDLVFAMECGGSDPFSGITANPLVGAMSDRLIQSGATVMFSELTELIGAEPVLEKRINDSLVRAKLRDKLERYVNFAKQAGRDIRGTNPTPGNIASGISTLEEKSLGAVIKGGHAEIKGVLDYAEAPTEKGLYIMDTPGNDAESVCGKTAGGAVLVLFTTGLGTPLGNPVSPILKIASNSRTYSHLQSFIDFDAGRIQAGESFTAVAEALFEKVLAVCCGEQTKAEINQCYEFAINRIGPTF